MNTPPAVNLSQEKLDAILPSPSSASLSDNQTDLSPPEEAQPIFQPTRSFLLDFFSICIITLAAALDATSLSIALPIIAEKTAIEAFWSGTSFLLTSAVFQPIIASLSHVFGRKELVLASIVFFFIGSVVSALANNFTMMLEEILVTDLVPLAVRGAWFGHLGSIWAIGSVTGPLMGGALNQTPGDLIRKIKNFDSIGSIFFVASSVSFLIPLTWGGIMYSWTSWRTLFPLIIGVTGVIGFDIYEYWLSKRAFDSEGNALPGNHTEPIIRLTIFNKRIMLITYLGNLSMAVQGYTPIISGVAILSETSFVARKSPKLITTHLIIVSSLTFPAMSVIVGIICAKPGRYRWAIYTGWLLTTLGAGVLIFLGPSTSIVSWICLNFPISIGTGMLFHAMAIATQATGRQEDAGHAAAFYSFTRAFGQSLGAAFGGVIFQNQIKTKLQSYELLAPMAEAYSKDATALIGVIKNLEDGLEKTQLIKAYADALSMIWVVMCAWRRKGTSLDQEHKTLQSFKDKERLADPEKSEKL